MFKKGLKVNLSNPLKNSAVRKLRGEIEAIFPGLKPYIEDLFPSKSKWIANKCAQKVIVYTEAKSSEPYFFHLNNGKGPLIPTVYLCWRFPDSIPIWFTPPDVWRRLHNGADLMLAGAYPGGKNGFQEFPKGAVRAVCIVGNPHVVAIGTTHVDSTFIKKNGRTGKGLIICHLYADPLWAMGSKSKPNEGFLKNKVVPIMKEREDDEEEGEESEEAEEPATEESDHKEGKTGGGERPEHEHGARNGGDEKRKDDGEDNEDDGTVQEREADEDNEHGNSEETQEGGEKGTEAKVTEEEIAEMKQNMDDAIEDLFFRALVRVEALPIAAADLYSEHMLPLLGKGDRVELKKSNYKKLANFVKSMEKEEVIALKQRKDGAVITGINRGHSSVQEYELRAKHEKIKGGDKKKKQRRKREPGRELDVKMLYMPSQKMMRDIFEPQGCKSKLVDMQSARRLLWGYVSANELGADSGKGVLIDPILRDVMFQKNHALKNKDVVSKRDLAKALTQNLQAYYCILFEDEEDEYLDQSMFKRGSPPEILIAKGARQGNKCVTMVKGVEPWEIDAKDLATLIRKKYACSTTVQTTVEKKKDIQVVIAQGELMSEIKGFLTHTFGVPGQYVNISKTTMKAPKKTKKGGSSRGGNRAKAAALTPS